MPTSDSSQCPAVGENRAVTGFDCTRSACSVPMKVPSCSGVGRGLSGYELAPSDTFIPRDYQLELFEAAKENNVIIALGTGTGKTFISILLINEMSGSIRKPWQEGGQRTFFLVNSVPLVAQQAFAIGSLTDLTVGQFCGSAELDCWNKRDWHTMFEKYQVLVMSSQIFLNIVLHGFMDPDRVNLLILDECHHAVKDSPMRMVMQSMIRTGRLAGCRVLGTTASVINRKLTPAKLESAIVTLENTLGCALLTSSDMLSVYKYCTKPVERVMVCDDFTDHSSLHRQLSAVAVRCLNFLLDHRYDPVEVFGEEYRQFLDDVPDPVTEPKHVISDFLHILESLGAWCADRCACTLLVEVQRLRRKTAYDRHFLLLGCVFTTLVHVRVLCSRAFRGMSTWQAIQQYSSPKLLQLLSTLPRFAPKAADQESHEASAVGTQFAEKPDSAKKSSSEERPGSAEKPSSGEKPGSEQTFTAIVFVKQRVTAKCLFHVLRELSESCDIFKFLRVQYVVGGSREVFLDPKLRKNQEDVLRRFRSGDCNLLVSTSVLEEGVDVPRCNLVIRFDPPTEFRSYLQSKGRARSQISCYLLMFLRADSAKLMKDLTEYRLIEKILLERSSVSSPVEPKLSAHIEALAESNIEPFIPNVTTGARVTRSSSISLINRYCSKLPSDNFTRLAPQWKYEKHPTHGFDMAPKVRCCLRMPINSMCKETLSGQWMPSRKLARQSVAVAMCRRLYELGELDDHLLPIGKEALVDEEETEDDWSGEVGGGGPRIGTNKRRQYYAKPMAECLKRAPISAEARVGTSCASGDSHADGFHLYQLRMRLVCAVPDDQNTRGRDIFRPEQQTRTLALLTFNPLPKLCEFPVYTRSGEVLVDVQPLSTCLALSSDQIQSLLDFHRYVFGDVLRLQKVPMSFQFVQSECGYIVVPVNSDRNQTAEYIDWPFLKSLARRYNEKPRPLSDQQRANYVYDAASLVDAVVVPWYRNIDEPQSFYVARVLNDLTPESLFPDGSFESFTAYYRDKYAINIQNGRQPLLDVDHTSVRLNLLTPRYVNRKGVALPSAAVTTRRAKLQQLEEKQILVPELCHVHALPGSLWRQLVALPSVLWRLNGLIVAEQLRQRVARETGLGHVTTVRDWPVMTFGWTLADALRRRGHVESVTDVPATQHDSNTAGSSFSIGLWDGGLTAKPAVATHQERVDDNNLDHQVDPEEEEISHARLPDNITVLQPELSGVGQFAGLRVGSPCHFDETDDGAGVDWSLHDVEASGSETEDVAAKDDTQKRSEAAGDNVVQGTDANTDQCQIEDDEEDIFDLILDSVTLKDVQDKMEKKIEAGKRRLEKRILLENSADLEMLQSSPSDFQHSARSHSPLLSPDQPIRSKLSKSCLTSPTERSEVADVINRPSLSLPDLGNITDHSVSLTRRLSTAVKDRESSELSSTAPRATHPLAEHTPLEHLPLTVIDGGSHDVPGCRYLSRATGHGVVPGSSGDDVAAFLDWHPVGSDLLGPSPSLLLQALTTSNANDGINLERLETVGDSFLKFAVTTHLYITYPRLHEGKLSYMRSKRVSNLNLYRLGVACNLSQLIVGCKFEPRDNWLPPGFVLPPEMEQQATMSAGDSTSAAYCPSSVSDANTLSFVPYNLLTQQSVPDKSVADCVEALIGAYLISSGWKATLVFMSWLGLKVLPLVDGSDVEDERPALRCHRRELTHPILPALPGSRWALWQCPPSPLSMLPTAPPAVLLEPLLQGLDKFEEGLGYSFNDKFYLLQALTHASYYRNTVTDCYQRLEFLGDAVLDYLITRHLYEDGRNHDPGALTDLRSALVNNTMFATLAVRYGFHSFFRHYSYSLSVVISRFLHVFGTCDGRPDDEYLYIDSTDCEDTEDVEIPKALGDLFESVAGAIYLDSGMSLDQVWRIYYPMMRKEIDEFSEKVPKSPIRELLEMEPDTAKFRKPERCVDGRIRVTVDIIGKQSFSGVGRNYRIAKCTAAKKALVTLRKLRAKREAAIHKTFNE